MGIKGLSSNRKKTFKSSKSQKWQRMVKAEKKKNLPTGTVDVEDVHLFSKEKLRNKLKNPKNNIKITGKKRRRLTKRLGHSLREKSQMDIEVTHTRSSRAKLHTEDEEMEETDDIEEHPAVGSLDRHPSLAPSSSSSSSSKKKKRGGKKHKKKGVTADAQSEGNVFETDNSWEDVEMG